MPDLDLHEYPHRGYARWNAGDFDGFIDSMIAEDVVDHTGGAHGREPVHSIMRQVLDAFPDHQYRVDQVVVEGDMLVVRLTASGTQKGDFFGYPATGKHATWTEMRMARIENDRTVEHWANVDTLGMLIQLGHVVPPGRSNW